MKKVLLFLLILMALVYSGVNASAAATSDLDREMAAEEAKMRELQRKIEEHRHRARQMGSQERTVLGELSRLQ